MKSLHNIPFEEYARLKNSGMFWVWFPEATGVYEIDTDGNDRGSVEGVEEEHKEQKHQHYFRYWNGKLDPYRICDLFEVNDAAISHAVKKLLCTGNRGHKDFRKDVEDVIDTLERKLEMTDEEDVERLRHEDEVKKTL